MGLQKPMKGKKYALFKILHTDMEINAIHKNVVLTVDNNECCQF
jgi:hypothetical protein